MSTLISSDQYRRSAIAVLGALAVGRMTVEDIMIDREEMVFLSTEISLSENLERLSGRFTTATR